LREKVLALIYLREKVLALITNGGPTTKLSSSNFKPSIASASQSPRKNIYKIYQDIACECQTNVIQAA
jgi:hypothetical protein